MFWSWFIKRQRFENGRGDIYSNQILIFILWYRGRISTTAEVSNFYMFYPGFIGYAPQIYSIVSNSEIENEDDDQLYYTKIFLDQRVSKKLF